jgi:hypothetical protein
MTANKLIIAAALAVAATATATSAGLAQSYYGPGGAPYYAPGYYGSGVYNYAGPYGYGYDRRTRGHSRGLSAESQR